MFLKASKILLVCTLLVACSEKNRLAPAEQAQLARDDLLTTGLKDKIARDLTDPSSAHFRNLKLGVAPDGERLLCGEVNSKNQFGAYAGFRWFAVFEKKRGGILEASTLSEDDMKEILNGAGCGYVIKKA